MRSVRKRRMVMRTMFSTSEKQSGMPAKVAVEQLWVENRLVKREAGKRGQAGSVDSIVAGAYIMLFVILRYRTGCLGPFNLPSLATAAKHTNILPYFGFEGKKVNDI